MRKSEAVTKGMHLLEQKAKRRISQEERGNSERSWAPLLASVGTGTRKLPDEHDNSLGMHAKKEPRRFASVVVWLVGTRIPRPKLSHEAHCTESSTVPSSGAGLATDCQHSVYEI